jgi:hypothetical protein
MSQIYSKVAVLVQPWARGLRLQLRSAASWQKQLTLMLVGYLCQVGHASSGAALQTPESQ